MSACAQCRFAAVCVPLSDKEARLLWDAYDKLCVQKGSGNSWRQRRKAKAFMNQRPEGCPARRQ